MTNLFIRVRRVVGSLSYMRDPTTPKSWINNDAHNSMDTFEVFEDADDHTHGEPIFTSRAQTVSNTEGLIDGMLYSHTVAAGPFELVAFVDQRAFYGRIHGIAHTRTIGGDVINADSVIPAAGNRWLVHDWQKHKPEAPGHDTRVAWSAGCFVLPDISLAMLGELFDSYKVKPGQRIPGILIQEERAP